MIIPSEYYVVAKEIIEANRTSSNITVGQSTYYDILKVGSKVNDKWKDGDKVVIAVIPRMINFRGDTFCLIHQDEIIGKIEE